MSIIRILDEHLSNQIAAGEVVERPASVVKELVENSLDAGADKIMVEVKGNGTRLIRVMDNGMGMDNDDVLLCLERHATSKIREETQLDRINTLGFRGEAIPSIGSVSRLTIISRPSEQELGTRAELDFGKLQIVREEGCSQGTIIEVRNLFGNQPARKKFLKSTRTEIAHIEEVIKSQALAFPQVSFSFITDGKQVHNYHSAPDFETRVRQVFRYQDELLYLAANKEELGLNLDGFLLLPEKMAASSARLRILVNRRWVQDKMLRHGVLEGMQGFLLKHHSPAGVIVVNINPNEVDVNVHPAKREVRFKKSSEIHALVAAAVREAIIEHQEKTRKELFPDQPVRYQLSEQTTVPSQFTSEPANETVVHEQQEELSPPSYANSFLAEPKTETGKQQTEVLAIEEDKESPPPLTLIGQLFNLYLLCSQGDNFIIIDQHAAHERILYTKLVNSYLADRVATQPLLFPVTVELPVKLSEAARQQQEKLTRTGVKAEEFGEETWVVKEVPALLSHLDAAEIFKQFLETIAAGSSLETEAISPALDEMFAQTACRAAIKGGDHLQPAEMIGLLNQMAESKVFSHCPHGRPVIKKISKKEVENWFKR